ncbi:GNAT family N-acetyltransferase [Streptomyces sp. JJ66]|uniref:GNAT family N-acetyltransferase n=1 Tax=Streptomyces sp. JJ66 TaxID=2803843 RepID=UPI001C56108F|nr:GNAT family N-acetyltransferase [Streptomyces sp. JJ66]MBW1601607.1 GNAT family N-acetyltransferase [Streptomyces sp. JJ66]
MLEITGPVKTERLILRAFKAGDEEDAYAFESRADVARYLYNEPRTREEITRLMTERSAQTVLRREGDNIQLAVEGDGTVIGYVLLTWVSERHQQGEFGYVLHPDYHGRGFATEAAVEMLRLGFDRLGLHWITARCDARNTASARVMERLGMRQEAHFIESEWVKGEWTSELHYALLAPEWRASRWASNP